MKHSIIIRIGAAYDSVFVNGVEIDRTKLDRRQKSELRNRLVGALEREGYFARGA